MKSVKLQVSNLFTPGLQYLTQSGGLRLISLCNLNDSVNIESKLRRQEALFDLHFRSYALVTSSLSRYLSSERKMSKFASNEMASLDTPKYHKISKRVLQQYQEQVVLLYVLRKRTFIINKLVK